MLLKFYNCHFLVIFTHFLVNAHIEMLISAKIFPQLTLAEMEGAPKLLQEKLHNCS